ncbi:hypothetical protein [Hymenobacter defluvii]|uniref:Helix-turn-helix domain-containing protein n=1 Tax=Hymenobacter defluvii TaxID=2054411 RepID=A0ABS3THS6_9BACT|nr:hypothetical protein [Hymenobacter defluvii]MBO3273206.1 hypothetical protein [Hymenobacter defluvii]
MEPVLPIREHLNQLTVLPSAARVILIEICEMVENGKKGTFFGGNEYLAQKACCHPVSVSKHLRLLKKAGLLTEYLENGNSAKRTLTPCPELVEAYTSGDLSGVSGMLTQAKQDANPTLSRGLSQAKQGANHTLVTLENTLGNTVLENPNVALSTSAHADHAPGILALEQELAQLKMELAKAQERLTKATEVYHTQQQELETVRQELSATHEQLAITQAENETWRTQLAKREKRAKRQPAPFAEQMPLLADWYPDQRAQLPAEEQQTLENFYAWAKDRHLPHVFSRNLTPRKVLALAKTFGRELLKTTLLEMENSSSFDDKKSADLTAETWLKREVQRQEQREQLAEERRYAHVNTTYTAGYNAYARRN